MRFAVVDSKQFVFESRTKLTQFEHYLEKSRRVIFFSRYEASEFS